MRIERMAFFSNHFLIEFHSQQKVYRSLHREEPNITRKSIHKHHQHRPLTHRKHKKCHQLNSYSEILSKERKAKSLANVH